jgi:hypothetical protein
MVENLIVRIVYWVIEEIDGYLPQTTSAKMAAASAIAASQTLDIPTALQQPYLPNQIQWVVNTFTEKDWKEVIGLAQSHEFDMVRSGLDLPQWKHLRRPTAERVSSSG